MAEASDGEAYIQWRDAVVQIGHYADGSVVQRLFHGTTPHSVVAQFRGYRLARLKQTRAESL